MIINKLLENDLDNGQFAIKQLWGTNHIYVKNKEFFKWSYYSKNNNDSGFFVAIDKGEIIGCIGKMPIKAHIYGKHVKSSYISLFVVSKNERSKGLGLDLLDYALNGSDFTFINGITKRASMLYKLKGFNIFKFPRYLYITSISNLKKYHKDFNFSIDFNNFTNVNELNIDITYNFIDFEQKYISLWNDFWKTFSQQCIGTIKDYSFLKWRYLDHPIFKYKLKLIFNKNCIVGLLVYRLIYLEDGLCLARVVDLITINDFVKINAIAFIKNIENEVFCIEFSEFLDKKWLNSINVVEADNILSSYFNPPSNFHTCILSALKANYTNINKMYISIADGDQDRPN